MDTLRDQLNLQKDSLQKYEGKIKRREAELKEKTQELRKLRAETANAKLQVDKGKYVIKLREIDFTKKKFVYIFDIIFLSL